MIEPQKIGRYELVERLGSGGMAEVFKARYASSHGFEKTLVLKCLLPELADKAEFVDMFVTEARIMAQLDHPNVVQVLDFGVDNGRYFIAMEYVKGMDLKRVLALSVRRRRRPPTAVSVYIIGEMLKALDHAHKKTDAAGQPLRIVHRDISPSNIFISDLAAVKLSDFGIAKATTRNEKSQVGEIKGKYGYVAPEMIGGVAVDARADIFSAGVVLAELLIVRRLFLGKTDLDTVLMLRDVKLDRLYDYGQHIPSDLMQILESALAKDPNTRYQDAAVFGDALRRFLFNRRLLVQDTDLRAFVLGLQQDRSPIPGMPVAPTTPVTPALGQPPLDRPVGPSAPERADYTPAVASAPAAPAAPRFASPAAVTPTTTPDGQPFPPVPGSGPGGPVPVPPAPVPPEVIADELPSALTPEVALPDMPGMASSSVPTTRMSAGGQARRPGAVSPAEMQAAALNDAATSQVGRKRKITLGPPPPTTPVSVHLNQTGEKVQLSTEQALAAVRELEGPRPSSRKIKISEQVSQVSKSVKAEPVDLDRIARSQVTAAGIDEALADRHGTLAETTLFSLFFDLALKEETGMLALRAGEDVVKEVFLVNGDPIHVSSNRADELFGQFLVAEGVLDEQQLSLAAAMLPYFKGRLGDSLVGLQLLSAIQVARYLTQQVRQKLLSAFLWQQGEYFFFEGRRCEFESAPLGWDGFEVLGAAIDAMPADVARERVAGLLDRRYRAVTTLPAPPEVFRLGSAPRQVLDKLDGQRTVEAVLDDAGEAREGHTRLIHLLIETGMAQPA